MFLFLLDKGRLISYTNFALGRLSSLIVRVSSALSRFALLVTGFILRKESKKCADKFFM